ncbi:MAG: hypothetical protein HWD61_09615 [Parachlamydiaceae bacterium]|nr:MAG: hypothetical protein HWD61_09615 [Parachlamydiaceae bacterium]
MIPKSSSFSDTEVPFAECEGAITSASNIRPDEVILKFFESKAIITIVFADGKFIDLQLHEGNHRDRATLVIPEKFTKKLKKRGNCEFIVWIIWQST